MELTNHQVIRELMGRHGISFTKSLGQNFLTNPSVSPRMAEESGITSSMGVLEIGPGVGVLTKELAQRAKKVVAIEIDRGLLPVLEETLADFDNVNIISGDVLKVNLPQLFKEEFSGMEVAVCANLPYYITTPILMNLLEQNLPIQSITVMVQKETAERFSAPIPSRAVGSITLSMAYYAKIETLFQVSRGSFLPPPNVDSTVIQLTLHKTPPILVTHEEDFFKVVRAAFSQRRKTVLNSLSSGLSMEKSDTRSLLAAADILPSLRAEQMSLEDFGRLANAYTKVKETKKE